MPAEALGLFFNRCLGKKTETGNYTLSKPELHINQKDLRGKSQKGQLSSVRAL